MKKILLIFLILSIVFPVIAFGKEDSTSCTDYCSDISKKNEPDDIGVGNHCICPDNCTDYCIEFEKANTILLGFPKDEICICNPLGSGTFETILNNLINFIFNIAVIVFPLMIMISALLFVTSGDSLERRSQAKKILIWGAIGFIVIMLAKALFFMVEKIIGVV